jgi:thiol-disulfide isomerase/thioredoxin
MRLTFLLTLLLGLSVVTQSQAELAEAKDYETRKKAVDKYFWRSSPDFHLDLEKFEAGSRLFIKDFPNQGGGYENLMALIEVYEEKKDSQKALALANELAADATPEGYRLWAKGCVTRLNAIGKPIRIQFVGADGREVDTEKMSGKVVLVDFWATTCHPCVRDLPQIKSLYEKYNQHGLEIIGISCNSSGQTDREKVREKLLQFLKQKEILWPQFFDGKQQIENLFAQKYGIDGIPHLFLIDKKGNLRFDNVLVKDGLEQKISKLLAE